MYRIKKKKKSINCERKKCVQPWVQTCVQNKKIKKNIRLFLREKKCVQPWVQTCVKICLWAGVKICEHSFVMIFQQTYGTICAKSCVINCVQNCIKNCVLTCTDRCTDLEFVYRFE